MSACSNIRPRVLLSSKYENADSPAPARTAAAEAASNKRIVASYLLRYVD